MEIYLLLPLNVVDRGNLVPTLLFSLLPSDEPCFWLLFEIFSPLLLCCGAPGCEPPEGLVSVSSDLFGDVYLELSCIGGQFIYFTK